MLPVDSPVHSLYLAMNGLLPLNLCVGMYLLFSYSRLFSAGMNLKNCGGLARNLQQKVNL